MLRFVSKLLGIDDPHADAKRAARLTEADALALARAASEGAPDVHTLTFAGIREEHGERLWVFTTASRGMQWQVEVRDADGRVAKKGMVGVR